MENVKSIEQTKKDALEQCQLEFEKKLQKLQEQIDTLNKDKNVSNPDLFNVNISLYQVLN